MTQVEDNGIYTAGQVEIVYYTDPLCCWSWGFEPQWRKLRYQFKDQVKWRYCMSGLLPGWNQFGDALNSVNRPAQMGPIWMEASHISGMPIQNRIWIETPPASSYLACIAVKCATLQSPSFEEMYLRLLREAVMLRGKNISVQSVLLDEAETLAQHVPGGFNVALFKDDLTNGRGLEAFRNDLNEVQRRSINRFPTLVFSSPNHASLLITGYRPYPALLEVLQQMAPGLQPTFDTIKEDDYRNYWGSLTERELQEATVHHEVLRKIVP